MSLWVKKIILPCICSHYSVDLCRRRCCCCCFYMNNAHVHNISSSPFFHSSFVFIYLFSPRVCLFSPSEEFIHLYTANRVFIFLRRTSLYTACRRVFGEHPPSFLNPSRESRIVNITASAVTK